MFSIDEKIIMHKDDTHRRKDVIAEEAACWFVTLQDGDAETKRRFTTWVKTSPEHVEEFLAIAALWDALPQASHDLSIDELVALVEVDVDVVFLDSVSEDMRGSEPTEIAATETVGSSRSRKSWRIGLAAAATLAMIMIGGALILAPPLVDPNLYTTAIGEQTSLPLPDGSLVTLNTQTTLRVSFSEEFRDIYLSQGEALFDVAKNSERPFRVITEHAVIQAVGTQFNVRRDVEDVTVTVVEGIVDVDATMGSRSVSDPVGQLPKDASVGTPAQSRGSTRLTIGQQARVAFHSGEVAVFEAAIDKATAWQDRRLVFEALSLSEVIDEFNRYNDPPILINDDQLRGLPINGVFRANDRESFVAFLDAMHLATAHTRADGTIVLRGVPVYD